MINLKHIIELYKEKRIRQISESEHRQMWEVDSHTVMVQIKKGRRILTCDCDNHTKYCNSPALCRHKEAVVAFPVVKEMLEQLNKKVESIESLKLSSNQEVKKTIRIILEELEDLQKLRWLKQLE